MASFSSSSPSLSSSSLKTLCAVEASLRRRLQCVSSSSAASFASGGGNGGFGGESGGGDGGGGGGKSGSDSGSGESNLVGGAGDEASARSSEVIILDVGVCVIPISHYFLYKIIVICMKLHHSFGSVFGRE